MINHDGVFQVVDISEGGFCFRCPQYEDALDIWIAEILTPIGDIKNCQVVKRWFAVTEDSDLRLPSFIKFGVKFVQLTKTQRIDINKIIGSISDYPIDWEINKGSVL